MYLSHQKAPSGAFWLGIFVIKLRQMPNPKETPNLSTTSTPEKVDYFDLEKQKKVLFEKLKDTGPTLPVMERDCLINRVFEHSLEDGLELADALSLGRTERLVGIYSPDFLSKHPDFAIKLNNKIKEYKPFLDDRNDADEADFLSLEMFVEGHLKDRESGLRTPAVFKIGDRRFSLPTKDLAEEIDHYYENFIRLRQVVEQETPLTGLSLGEQLGETNIEQARLALEPHYYTAPIVEYLRANDKNPDVLEVVLDLTTMFSSNLVGEEVAREILAMLINVEKTSLEVMLEKARFRPLGQVFNIENQSAQKELKAELEISLRNRGYKPEDFELRFNKTIKKYEVIDKTGKQEKGFTKENLRLAKEVPAIYEMSPDDPYYEKMAEDCPEEIDINTKKLRLWRKFVEAGDEVWEKIHDRAGNAFFLYPNGKRSKMYKLIEDIKKEGDKILFTAVLESRQPEDNSQQVVVDGEFVNSDNSFGTSANECVVEGDDIYWIGTKQLVRPGMHDANTEYQSVIFKNGRIIKGNTISKGWFSNLAVKNGVVSYRISRGFVGHEIKQSLFTGEREFGPYRDLVTASGKSTDYFYAEKDSGEKIIYNNGEELPINLTGEVQEITKAGDEVFLVVITEVKVGSGPMTREYRNIINQQGEVVSDKHRQLNLFPSFDGKLTYSTNTDTVRSADRMAETIHFGDRVIEGGGLLYPVGILNGRLLYTKMSDGKVKNLRLKLLGRETVDLGIEQVNPEDITLNNDQLGIPIYYDGKVHRYLFYSPEFTLTDSEQRKLELLNALMLEEVEPIKDYLAKYHPEREVEPLNKLKNYLKRSKKVAGTISELIKASPSLFLDLIKAKSDDTTNQAIDHLIFSLFPDLQREIEWRKRRSFFDRGSGHSRSDGSGIFDGRQNTTEFRDGDPKQSVNTELLHLREPMNEMLSTGIYGRYDSKRNLWEQAPFPLATNHIGSTREVTAEIQKTKGKKSVILPKGINASIIPERVIGIKAGGIEVALTPEFNTMGEARVKLKEDEDGEDIERVIYSQTIQDLPLVPETIGADEYQKFKMRCEKNFGLEVSQPIAKLPTELKVFVKSIVGLSPVEKLEAIESFVRSIAHYDFDNRTVQAEKSGKNITEIISVMTQRLKDLKRTAKPEERNNFTNKKYAGVCADFAKLTTALLRECGFVSGMIQGLQPGPGETVLTDKNSHGVSFALWPAESYKAQVIVLDGTPSGTDDEEEKLLANVRFPSLSERSQAFKEQLVSLNNEAERELTALERLVASLDVEEIKKLQNGKLEKALNIILKEVKESHLNIIRRALNASRYAGFDLVMMAHGDNAQEQAFQRFLVEEIAKERKTEKSEAAFKGGDLLNTIEEFTQRYSKDGYFGGELAALDIIQRIFDLSREHLNPVELRSATAVVTYLHARGMSGH